MQHGMLPPPDAVRIEEFINYFTYDYQPPADEQPFALHVEIAECPWKSEHKLVRVGIKGREIENEQRPPCNLVFLLDVSGSMDRDNKLPLLKRAMKMLVSQLNERVIWAVSPSGATGPAIGRGTEGRADRGRKRLSCTDRAGGVIVRQVGPESPTDVATRHWAAFPACSRPKKGSFLGDSCRRSIGRRGYFAPLPESSLLRKELSTGLYGCPPLASLPLLCRSSSCS